MPTATRKPSQSHLNNYINTVFQSHCIKKKSFYILGDLNDDMLSQGNKLSKIVSNIKLKQLVENPTRITDTSATLLDVIITNNP